MTDTTSTAVPPEVSSRRQTLLLVSRYGTLAALLLLLIFNVAVTPNFLAMQTLYVNLTQVAPIVIVAIGMTLVIATGGIDLSVGSLMAISGAIAPMIFMGKIFPIESVGVAVTLAFILPVLAVMVFGWFNGFLVTRFRIQPIVATLVLFIAGRGIAQVATNGNLQVFKSPEFQFIGLGRVVGVPALLIVTLLVVLLASGPVRYILNSRHRDTDGGVKRLIYVISASLVGLVGLFLLARPLLVVGTFGIPAQVILMIIVAILAAALIRYTVVGRQIIAVGGNEKAARLAGVPVHRVKQLVYVISGGLAGIAGLIVIARNAASDANLVGLGMELDAIAAVAVGGTLLTGGKANITGTIVGAFVIQLMQYTLLANGVPDAAARVVKAALIILAVFIQQRANKA